MNWKEMLSIGVGGLVLIAFCITGDRSCQRQTDYCGKIMSDPSVDKEVKARLALVGCQSPG